MGDDLPIQGLETALHVAFAVPSSSLNDFLLQGWGAEALAEEFGLECEWNPTCVRELFGAAPMIALPGTEYRTQAGYRMQPNAEDRLYTFAQAAVLQELGNPETVLPAGRVMREGFSAAFDPMQNRVYFSAFYKPRPEYASLGPMPGVTRTTLTPPAEP